MATTKYILFDAANTLIHKPDLWVKLMEVFQSHQVSVPLSRLQYHHKMVSEYIDFPDQTSKDFYLVFNKELLLSLGIIPTDALLADMFAACSYLPWLAFEDTVWLKECQLPMGVLSNFNSSLTGKLEQLFGAGLFTNIFVSEALQVRKPNTDFYNHAIQSIGLAPEDIIYIGDSFKLDIIPGLRAGLNTLLIDRIGVYASSTYAISSLHEINKYIQV